jgi:hypothetical protein
MKNLVNNVFNFQRLPFQSFEKLNFFVLFFAALLVGCNPNFEQEISDLEGGGEASTRISGNFTISLLSATTPSKPEFTVRGDLKIGQKIKLYTGNNCETPRDEKQVTNSFSVRLISSPLINNGIYTYKIKVFNREGQSGPCLSTRVRYSFTNGFTLPSPSVAIASTNIQRQPNINVTGAQQGNPVSFYTDASCTQFIGSANAGANGEANLVPPTPLEDGTYRFYAKTIINGEIIECSAGSSAFVIDSKVKNILLQPPLNETDNKNTINLLMDNLIENAKVYVYETNDCSSSPIYVSPSVTDPSNFVLTLGQKPDSSYHINQEKTYRFNFRQEKYAGSGASNLSPCSSDQLVYKYDITPKNPKIADGFSTTTNKLFSPTFQYDNFNNTATIRVFRNNNCSGAPLINYTYSAAANGTLTIPTDPSNRSLIGQPDGTYQYTFIQTIDGVDSACSTPVSYTVLSAPGLTLESTISSPSSNPFPKFLVSNVASDQNLEVFASEDCTSGLINSGNYTVTELGGGSSLISFTSPRVVTANGEDFSVRQLIADPTPTTRTSACSNSINYHVNSSSLGVAFAAGQLSVGRTSTPKFTFSNTLDNSEIHIFQEANSANCENPAGVPTEPVIPTGTNSSLDYTITNALTDDGQFYYYIREYLDLPGATDYYSDCIRLTYRRDTMPKSLTLNGVSQTDTRQFPGFRVDNIGDPTDFELIRSTDNDCTTTGNNTVMPIDLVNDVHNSSTAVWLFKSTQALDAEGGNYFFVRNTNFTSPAGCSNSTYYRLKVTPALQLAAGTASGTNDLLPEVRFTNLIDDYVLHYYFDDDCGANEFTGDPEFDFTDADGAPTDLVKTLDIRPYVTSDGTYNISAQYENGAFASECRSISYAIDGKIKTIQKVSPTSSISTTAYKPTYRFRGLIPDTQIRLYSSESDCNSNTNLFTSLPAVTDANGSDIDFSFDITNDIPALLPTPISDGEVTLWAKQHRSSNGYNSECVEGPSYTISALPTGIQTSNDGTLITAPYIGIQTNFDNAADVEIRLFTDETCSTAIPGTSGVNVPGLTSETYGFLVDYDDPNLPFNRSGTYDIYAQIFRDDPGDTLFAGTHLSDCASSISYGFNAIPNNIRFVSGNVQTGETTFNEEPIPLINTPTPAFLVDNIIDHVGTVVSMHIDQRDGGSPTNNKCSEDYTASEHDPLYSGSGYRVENGVIPGDGVYTVYFKQKVGDYNDNGPNFDCSEGFTFEVNGIPDGLSFASTNFSTDVLIGSMVYVEGQQYRVISVTDDFNLVLSGNVGTTSSQSRFYLTHSNSSTGPGNVTWNGVDLDTLNGSGFIGRMNPGDIIYRAAGNFYVEEVVSDNEITISSSTPLPGSAGSTPFVYKSVQGTLATGKVSFNSGTSTTQINGNVATLFTTEVGVGDLLLIQGSYYKVDSITDDQTLDVLGTTPLATTENLVNMVVIRNVVPGVVSTVNGSPNITGQTTLSPDVDMTPSIVIEGVADDLHVQVFGITDEDYNGTPSSICNDGDAIAVSDYIDSDVIDDSLSNVMIFDAGVSADVKHTTIPINLSNTLLLTDNSYHFAVHLVGNDVNGAPDPGAFSECTTAALSYIIESTPSGISIVGETDDTINNHKPTFNFSNLVRGRGVTSGHKIRAYYGAGDQSTALANCDADTTGVAANYYAENSGVTPVADSINGAAEFTQDGTYFVYFKQFHPKDAGGGDEFASDCLYNTQSPGSGIFSFDLDGELKNPVLQAPASNEGYAVQYTIRVENYRKSAGRSIQIFNDDSTGVLSCGSNLIDTITDANITETSPGSGIFEFTTSRITDSSDVNDLDDLYLWFRQVEDGYVSRCSTEPVYYNLNSRVEMTFTDDATPSDKTFESEDPTPSITIDLAGSVINDPDNTLEFHLTSDCSGAAIDSVADPHNAARLSTGRLDLNGLSADGSYDIYVRQVLSETNDYTGECFGPHKYTLTYANEGQFVAFDPTATFMLEPEYIVTTAEANLDINVYLNDNTCNVANLVATLNDAPVGNNNIRGIYLIEDRSPHDLYFQLDNDAGGYVSACIQPSSASPVVNGRPTALTIPAGTTSNNPTPTVEVSGIIGKNTTDTIVSLYLDSSCNNASIGSITTLGESISNGKVQIQTDVFTQDNIYTIFARQQHDTDRDGYNAGTDYQSNCSLVNVAYTLDGEPTNITPTGATPTNSAATNLATPTYTLKNIFSGHIVEAYPSQSDCQNNSNELIAVNGVLSGDQMPVTVNLEDDGTYYLSFKQTSADGSYESDCTSQFEYNLDRRPTGISFNSATNELQPTFDVTGTDSALDQVRIYTSLDDGGDGCDVLRGNASALDTTTTVTASTLELNRDGEYKFYARMINAISNGNITGTVSFNVSSGNDDAAIEIIGDSTNFTVDLNVGNEIIIAGNSYKITHIVDDELLHVQDGQLSGSESGETAQSITIDETACSDAFATYILDLKPNNLTFDTPNPGKSLRPKLSMTGLLPGATVYFYYIDDATTAFDGFADPSGCPSVGSTFLGQATDSNNDRDLEPNTDISWTNLFPDNDPDKTYPIYAYQELPGDDYASKCNHVADYVLNITPQFESDWNQEPHSKKDVFDIEISNLVTASDLSLPQGSAVYLYEGSCPSDPDPTVGALSISNSSNTNLTEGAKTVFTLNLASLGAGLSDNTTYNFFARQIFPDGSGGTFDSGCTTLSSASYHFDSAPIVTGTLPGTTLRRPILQVSEVVEGTRNIRIVAVPNTEDICSAGTELFNSAVSTAHAGYIDTVNEMMNFQFDLTLSGNPFVADGTYNFRVEQTLDSGRVSGCYEKENSATYTLDSKLVLDTMVPAGGFGSSALPQFTFENNPLDTVDNYEIDVYVNDTDCDGNGNGAEFTDWENHPDYPAVDLTELAAGYFTSNYVRFNFKLRDPSGEHTGTVCSDTIIYDYGALELDLSTPSPDPNDDLSPLVDVLNVNPSDTIKLYSDDSCSNLIATFVAPAGTDPNIPVLIETNPLTTDGTIEIHATRTPSGGNETFCSIDHVEYEIDIQPTTFAFTGGGSVGVDSTPSFVIDGVLDAAQINLYRDSACTELAGIGTTAFGVNNITITSNELPADGQYNYHITQTKASTGFASKCSTVGADYTLLSKPSLVSLMQNNPSSEARPYFRVDGVAENSTVRLFRDDGNGGDGCDTEIGNIVSAGTTVDLQMNAGVLTTTTTIDVYARHEVGAVIGGCSDSFVSYNFDTTKTDWSVTYANRFESKTTQLGNSVAIDDNIMVIGEPEYDGSGNKQGRIRILEKDAGVWSEVASTQSNDIDSYDQFGYAVDIYSAGSNVYYIVASAPYHDTTAGNDNRGSIYVFKYNAATESLTQRAIINPVDPVDNDNIGHAVAIHDDTIAFSTITRDSGKGKVYYHRSTVDGGNNSNYDYSLGAGFPIEFNNALGGNSLSLDANYLVAGAPGDESVFIYDLGNSYLRTQVQEATVTNGHEFGYSVSHNGTHLAVGIPGAGADVGRAKIYDITNLSADPIEITDSNAASNNRFGQKIAISKTGNYCAITAPGTNSNAGRAYIFSGASFDVETDVTSFGVTTQMEYGYSIDYSNTTEEFVISAPASSSSIIAPGVYIHNAQ